MPSYQEFAITIYQTKEDIETSWKSTHNIIKEYATSELQSIEDYRIVYSSNGRSVSLRSNKYGGFPSVLLFLQKVNNGIEFFKKDQKNRCVIACCGNPPRSSAR